MLKTFCFIYRKSADCDTKLHYVQAEGWVQASSLAKRQLGLANDVLWYCVPARRNTIRQYMNILAPDYKGGCIHG